MNVTNLLKKLGRLFGLFGDRWLDGVERAAPYLSIAYEVVETAARLTPNRTDDEIVELARFYGVPELWNSEDKGAAIRYVVYRVLKHKLPLVPDRVLNRAIELAYGALRP
jgi:hypothetical protein